MVTINILNFVVVLALLTDLYLSEGIIKECKEADDVPGIHYRGTVNTTKSGHACQKWDSNKPNDSFLKSYTFPNDDLDNSYCRGPVRYSHYQRPLGPWCWKRDEKGGDYCDIPICGKPIFQPTGSAFSTSTYKDKYSTLTRTTFIRPDRGTGRTEVSGGTIRTGWVTRRNSFTTHRPTFLPSTPAPTTPPRGKEAFSRKLIGDGSKLFLLVFHGFNLVLTAIVNPVFIFIVVTRINLRKDPSVIPLLVACFAALLNLGTNYGFYTGITRGEVWLYQMNRTLCWMTDCISDKISLFQVVCYSIVTLEAAYAMQYPMSYKRSSRRTFWTIIGALLLNFLLLLVQIYFYFYWTDTPDFITSWILKYGGEAEGIHWYRDMVYRRQKTFGWVNYFMRCRRHRLPGSWDYILNILTGLIPSLWGIVCMTYTLAQAFNPSRKRRNFIAAVSGKHNFTVEDLEDDERRAKSVSLITMVCSIVPALLYIIYFMIYLNPKSEDTLGYIFGVDQFYWIMEMLQRLCLLTSWLPALVSLFLNPSIARAVKRLISRKRGEKTGSV